MLTDPQSVTINSVAISLPRVSAGANAASYQSNDGLTKLSISHIYGKRARRVIRLDLSKIAPDPLISSTNIKYSTSIYVVVDQPVTGYTPAELKLISDGFVTLLGASTGAIMTRLYGGES